MKEYINGNFIKIGDKLSEYAMEMAMDDKFGEVYSEYYSIKRFNKHNSLIDLIRSIERKVGL